MQKENLSIQLLVTIALLGTCILSFNPYFQPIDAVKIYDYKRLFLYSLIVLTCLTLLLSRSTRQHVIQVYADLSTITKSLLLAMFVFSMIANVSALYPMRSVIDFLSFSALFLMTATLTRNLFQYKSSVFEYFSFILVLLFASVLVGHYLAIKIDLSPSNRSILSFVNPRMMNQVQVWLTLPVFYLSIVNRSNRKKLLSATATVMSFSLLFALDARGVTIALVSGITLWACFDKVLRQIILKRLVAFLLIGYLIKLIFLAPIPEFLYTGAFFGLKPDIRLDSPGRFAMWRDALQLLSFWGYGGDGYVCNAYPVANGPHNSVILLWFNWGFGTALSYLMLLFSALFIVYKTQSRLVRISGISVLTGFAYSLVSQVITTPLSQLLGCISIALFWSTYRHYYPIKTFKANPTIMAKIILFSAIIASMLAVVYRSHDRITNNFHLDNPPPLGEKYKPQTWLSNNCPDEPAYLRISSQEK